MLGTIYENFFEQEAPLFQIVPWSNTYGLRLSIILSVSMRFAQTTPLPFVFPL